MANNLNIPEVTAVQLCDKTNAINIIGVAATNRKTWDQVLTVRVTDHVSNVALEEDDPEKMAIFESKAHGQPWMRRGTHLSNLIFQQAAVPVAVPVNAEVYYPNFDYTEFD